jgi:autotransporter-associated beta strand protein
MRVSLSTMMAAAAVFAAMPSHAQDATWNNTGTGDFNTAGNWTPNTQVPTGTAFFGTSNQNAVSFSDPTTTIGGWTINAPAPAPPYTFTLDVTNTLSFNGAGIVINAGSATITNGGVLEFFNSSTAGNAAITTDNNLRFHNSSTAGSATITNSNFGFIQFLDSSTGGNATINNNVAFLQFHNTSTAGNATITNNGGLLFFIDNSTAGNAAIINTINTDVGVVGVVDFSGTSGPAGNNQITAGSIAGDGSYELGSNQLTVGGNNLSTEVSGTIVDDLGFGGSLVKVGTGTLTLSGVNTYSGGTTINAGTLAVFADHNLGASTGGLAFGGGTLQFLAGFTTNRAVTLNAGGGTFDTFGNNSTLGGTITGAGGLTKIGAGTLTLSGSSSYSGATAVNAGVLQAGATNAFAPLSGFTVAGSATLDLNGFNQTIGSLAGSGSVTLGSATLTTGNDNTSTAFSGTILEPIREVSIHDEELATRRCSMMRIMAR